MNGFAAAMVVFTSLATQVEAPRAALAVPIDDGLEETAEQLEAALLVRGFQLVPRAFRRGLGAGPAPTNADREQARAAILRARAALRALDIPLALAASDDAIGELVEVADVEDHLGLMVDALLLRGSLLAADGRDDDADLDLRLAARLEPGREALDEALHPPSLVARWAAARERNDADDGAPVTLVIRPRSVDVNEAAAVEGAEDVSYDSAVQVVVDGREVDVVDGIVTLGGGPHLVQMRNKRGSARRRVNLNEAITTLEPLLEPADASTARYEASQRVREGEAGGLLELRRLTGADLAVAVAGEYVLVSANVLRGVATIARTPAAGPSAIAESVMDLLLEADAAEAARLRSPTEDPSPRPPPSSFEEDTPPWGLIAGGGVAFVVVAAITGTVLWLTWEGEVPPPPPKPIPIVCCP